MFSIVIPVRDKPHTIERTLDSLFAQSFADFEVVLVGDPADQSMAMAERSGDARIRVAHQVNCGQGPARNAGIQASRGDWIAFLDADDIWLPDHLAELDAIRSVHPEAGLIGTRFLISDERGRFRMPTNRRGTISRVDYFKAVGDGTNVLFTSSAAIPRVVVDRLGGFGGTHFGEDTEFWVRIALALPVATSTRATVVYVRGTGGITDTGRNRWAIAPLASARDISPAVRLAIDSYASIESTKLRRSLDRFIRRYFDWCLRASIAQGDLRTIRRLRQLYWGRPMAMHVLLLAIGMLPSRPARALYAIGFRIKALARRARWSQPSP
jgi:glycosyltransferase involved in cell wall biosynthesis